MNPCRRDQCVPLVIGKREERKSQALREDRAVGEQKDWHNTKLPSCRAARWERNQRGNL